MRPYRFMQQAVLAWLLAGFSVAHVMGQFESAGNRVASPQPAAAQPSPGTVGPAIPAQGAPAWFPLSPQLQKHTDEVLQFWEFHSAKIDRYRCNFERWEYDRQNFHPSQPVTFATGKIMYAKPDKGLFEVTAVQQGKKGPGGQIIHELQPATEQEKWICDGRTVFEFDPRNKRLIERALPENMQGRQIVEGPLPFLFGAKKAQIEARYWVRVNPEKQGVFWLEAVPKLRENAADFAQVDIVIPDDEKFLPVALILHHRGGTQTTFQFTDRESNWNEVLAKLAIWERAFYNPATPLGWKREKETLPEPTVPSPPDRAAARQAQQNLPGLAPR